MMFLWLIPLAIVDQKPTYLFDVGDSGCKEHLDALPESTWLDPQHLPDFGQILANVNSSANPVYQAVVNKPHYMRALFVAQIKGSVWQDNLLKICEFINSQLNTKAKSKKAKRQWRQQASRICWIRRN